MPQKYKLININYYQYINDNKAYRDRIKQHLLFNYNHIRKEKDLTIILSQLQTIKLIDLLDTIDNLINRQFMIIDILYSRQMLLGIYNCDNDYYNYLNYTFEQIYRTWPSNCQLPQINKIIHYKDKFNIDFRLKTNPNQHIPFQFLKQSYMYPIQFTNLIGFLQRNDIYPSKIRNYINKLIVTPVQIYHHPSYNKIMQKIFNNRYQSINKQKLYHAIRYNEQNKNQLTSHLIMRFNEYNTTLIQLLLLMKYQKRLKNKIWKWYQTNHIQPCNQKLMQYLKNYYQIHI